MERECLWVTSMSTRWIEGGRRWEVWTIMRPLHSPLCCIEQRTCVGCVRNQHPPLSFSSVYLREVIHMINSPRPSIIGARRAVWVPRQDLAMPHLMCNCGKHYTVRYRHVCAWICYMLVTTCLRVRSSWYEYAWFEITRAYRRLAYAFHLFLYTVSNQKPNGGKAWKPAPLVTEFIS